MLKIKFFSTAFVLIVTAVLALPGPAHAMHIMEGYLHHPWWWLWYLVTMPFFAAGLLAIRKTLDHNPRLKMLLAFAGAFAFALSALKLPSVTGSCSHPTGVGLGAILFGPAVMTVLGTIVLLFQALLLGHGGITTLGANAFSMAVTGPLVAYGVFRGIRYLKAPLGLAVFLGASLGDLATYLTTAVQLALAVPDESGGILMSFYKFGAVFGLTQVPLAISEGLLTVFVFNLIYSYSKDDLVQMAVIPGEVR